MALKIKKEDEEAFDEAFSEMVNAAHRQRERDFPHFAIRSGILDGASCVQLKGLVLFL